MLQPFLPRPYTYSFTVLACLFLFGCAAETPMSDAQQGSDYITFLGSDTLAVESARTEGNVTSATVVFRSPQTTYRTYELTTASDGGIERFEEFVYSGGAATGEPTTQRTITRMGDSLQVETARDGEMQTRMVSAEAVMPFLDTVHWPLDVLLQRAYATGEHEIEYLFLTGNRTRPFVFRRLAPDSMTIEHPTRGAAGVTVSESGELVVLDAGETTRKVRVVRGAIDIEALGQRFAARDAAGQSFGALSTRGEATADVHGATITVDYGVPYKRGRAIFGSLVSWGERWRTGANRATHFTTDTDLRFGDVAMPAGTYTLSTIPQPDGGLLLINTQTDQGGTTYNADQDLGRVPMTIAALPESVEAFTIRVEEDGDAGVLRLQWDQTEFRIPFTVE